ncbi:hypothetical protein B7P43_G09257, partial [Cryptotermes secundus]
PLRWLQMSDGMVERYINTFEEHSRKVVTSLQMDWDERLPLFLLAYRHLKLGSDRMNSMFDKLANSAGYHEGDNVWLYRPARRKGTSPKLQSSLEGFYNVLNRINDVVYRIQENLRSRMLVVHLDRLALIMELLETRNHKKEAGVAVGERKTGRKEIPSQTRRRCKYRIGKEGPVMHCTASRDEQT